MQQLGDEVRDIAAAPTILEHGGEGSGNWGHAGRPGEVGGSGPGGGGGSVSSGKSWSKLLGSDETIEGQKIGWLVVNHGDRILGRTKEEKARDVQILAKEGPDKLMNRLAEVRDWGRRAHAEEIESEDEGDVDFARKQIKVADAIEKDIFKALRTHGIKYKEGKENRPFLTTTLTNQETNPVGGPTQAEEAEYPDFPLSNITSEISITKRKRSSQKD